jgi:uncharacterized phage infection (PIP) family protein YhgE
MDIMNPTAPAVPYHEAQSGQEAIDEAEKALAAFKEAIQPLKKEADKVYQVAKELIWALHNHCKEGRAKMTHQDWTQSEYDDSRETFRKSQDKDWEKVLKDADELRLKVDGHYKLVQTAKENVDRARGVGAGPFGNVLGFAQTNDQKMADKAYKHSHLKDGFHEAEKEYNELSSDPFGTLTKVGYLEKKSHFNLGIVPPTDV